MLPTCSLPSALLPTPGTLIAVILLWSPVQLCYGICSISILPKKLCCTLSSYCFVPSVLWDLQEQRRRHMSAHTEIHWVSALQKMQGQSVWVLPLSGTHVLRVLVITQMGEALRQPSFCTPRQCSCTRLGPRYLGTRRAACGERHLFSSTVNTGLAEATTLKDIFAPHLIECFSSSASSTHTYISPSSFLHTCLGFSAKISENYVFL